MNVSDLITYEDDDSEILFSESDLDDLDDADITSVDDLDLVPSSIQGLLDEADEKAEETKEKDWENDGNHGKFLTYALTRLQNIPKHNGQTTVGCERAISYLRRLDKEISRAIQSDDKNVIDEEEAEKIRDEVFSYVESLEKALDKISSKKRKKSAMQLDSKIFTRIAEGGIPTYFAKVSSFDEEVLLEVEIAEPSDLQTRAYIEWEDGKITKTADTAKVMLMADPFLHEISNIIIRAHTTYGRDVEDIYHELDAKYKFTDRDHLAVHSLLREKGLLVDQDFSKLGEELEIGQEPYGSKVYPG